MTGVPGRGKLQSKAKAKIPMNADIKPKITRNPPILRILKSLSLKYKSCVKLPLS